MMIATVTLLFVTHNSSHDCTARIQAELKSLNPEQSWLPETPSLLTTSAMSRMFSASPSTLQGNCVTPRQLAYEDLPRLTYLNAVVDETMRLFPVAATGSVR